MAINDWRILLINENILIYEPFSSWYVKTPLSRQTAYYLCWELVAKTRITYHFVRKSYVSSCQIAGAHSFPTSLFNLACWIAKLGIWNLKAKTIKSYLASIHLSQVNIGTTQDELKMFSHSMLFCTISGIRQINSKANTWECHPIIWQILLSIFPLFDITSLWEATMYASFYLALAIFLQIGEFT